MSQSYSTVSTEQIKDDHNAAKIQFLPEDPGVDKNTYVVILNQGDHPGEGQGVRPYTGLDTVEIIQTAQHVGERYTSVLPAGASDQNDAVRMNLNLGFDNYDSSNSALKVFSEEKKKDEDEGFAEATHKKTQIMIPRVQHMSQLKNLPEASVQKGFSPCGSFYVYNSPDNEGDNLPYDANPQTCISRMDVTGSSGYNSADISLMKGSYETPSPHIPIGKHPAARPIFLMPNYANNSGLVEALSEPSLFLQSPNMAKFVVGKAPYFNSTPNSGLVMKPGRNSYTLPSVQQPCPFTDTANITPDVEYQTAGGSKVTLSKSIPQLVNTCKFRGKSKEATQQNGGVKSSCSSPIIFINPDDNTFKKNTDTDMTSAETDVTNKSVDSAICENSNDSQQACYQKSSKVGDVVVHVRVESRNSSTGPFDVDNSQSGSEDGRDVEFSDVMNGGGARPSFCVRNFRGFNQTGEQAQTLSLPTYNVTNLPLASQFDQYTEDTSGGAYYGQPNKTSCVLPRYGTSMPKLTRGNRASRSLLRPPSFSSDSQNSQLSMDVSASQCSQDSVFTSSQESVKSEPGEKGTQYMHTFVIWFIFRKTTGLKLLSY